MSILYSFEKIVKTIQFFPTRFTNMGRGFNSFLLNGKNYYLKQSRILKFPNPVQVFFSYAYLIPLIFTF